MDIKLEELYELGKQAQAGNEISLIKIIEIKRDFIKKISYDDEDCYQYILERVIKAVKNFKFHY